MASQSSSMLQPANETRKTEASGTQYRRDPVGELRSSRIGSTPGTVPRTRNGALNSVASRCAAALRPSCCIRELHATDGGQYAQVHHERRRSSAGSTTPNRRIPVRAEGGGKSSPTEFYDRVEPAAAPAPESASSSPSSLALPLQENSAAHPSVRAAVARRRLINRPRPDASRGTSSCA